MSAKLSDVLMVDPDDELQQVQSRYRAIFEPVFGESEKPKREGPHDNYISYCAECYALGRHPISKTDWRLATGKD